jgi:Flp pilus assembly protein TadG
MVHRREGGATRSLRPEEGAAAVEFAIVAILLLMILFGLIEFGMWIAEYENVTSAAREGARVAAVKGDVDGVPGFSAADVNYAVTHAAAPYVIGPGTPTADIDCGATGNIGRLVTVSWQQHFNVPNLLFLLPQLPGTRPGDTHLIQGAFRCE